MRKATSLLEITRWYPHEIIPGLFGLPDLTFFIGRKATGISTNDVKYTRRRRKKKS